MRTGIFGGTFNPIHLGHLRSAEEVRQQFDLDVIFFVPSNLPPHKNSKDIVPADARLKMVSLAIKGHRYFKCSDVDIRHGGRSYSVDTVRNFLKNGIRKDLLFFIMGEDTFAEIRLWKDYRELLTLCNFIVTNRPGSRRIDFKMALPLDLRKKVKYNIKSACYRIDSIVSVYPATITGLDISSQKIRGILEDGNSISYLVPDKVERFIKKTGLYKN